MIEHYIRCVLCVILYAGGAMAAVIDSVKIKGIEVPLLHEYSSSLPTVNMQVVFSDSGSITDDNLNGLASMSARLLNEGTKKDGSVEFARKLENKAIHLGVSAGAETFVVDMSCLKSEFDEAVSLARKLLRDPNYSDSAFEKVQTRIRSNLLSKKNDFDYIANINLISNLFKETPLSGPQIGTLESIDNIKLQDIKEFVKKHLVLRRAIVLVGGDIPLEEAKKSAKSVLSLLHLGEKPDLGFYNATEQPFFTESFRDTKQSYIYFGSPLYVKAKDKDAHKAKVAAFVLGSSGFGSRIMEEIRVKRGLAYSAYMRFNINKSHSYASGHLQTKLESQKEAMKVVKEVVGEFVQKGITQKELDSAKKFLLGSEPLRNETLNQRLSSAFSEFYKELPQGYRKQELKKIEKLSLKEMNDFIKEHDEITKLSFSVLNKEKAATETQ